MMVALACAAALAAAAPDPSVASARPPAVSPRLADAAAAALARNPAVLAARQAACAAGYDVAAARWLRFPSVSLRAGSDGLGDVRADLEVFQPLWDGGRIAGGIDRARAVELAARAGVAETELDVLLRLSAAYHEAMRARRVAAVMGESVAEHRLLVASMERRVAQEVSPRTDLELARARAAQVEAELAAVEAQARAAEQRVRTLTGEPGFDLGPPPEYRAEADHPVDASVVDAALRCHPRIARLTAEAAVAQAEVRLRRAEALPTLGAQYTRDRFGGDQLGLALRVQTSGGLAPLASADAAAARRLGVDQQAALARQEVEEQVTLDLVDNLAARARIASTGVAAEATTTVTESFLRQFTAGRRTWLDVMNAVRERTAARITRVEVETSAMASASRLLLNSCAWPEGAAS